MVAEGVQTEVQTLQLEALGCHYGQGAYFSWAVPAGEEAKLLARTMV